MSRPIATFYFNFFKSNAVISYTVNIVDIMIIMSLTILIAMKNKKESFLKARESKQWTWHVLVKNLR